MTRLLVLCGVIVGTGGVVAHQNISPPAQTGHAAAPMRFAQDIRPILAGKCFTCHGPDDSKRKAKLRLDLPEEATKKLRSGNYAVVPGHPEKSELVARIYAQQAEERMPPADSHLKLSEHEKELLKQWVAAGARYEQHWAFVAPQRPALPQVKTRDWARNAIDYFILARLEKEGLQPSSEADRYTLARRVAIDLTGLPPTPEQADRFANDPNPNAYERYVEELLEAPAYGERWAAVWLDLARYADSNGFAEDNPRSIWRYRDWVIRAINQNMPFDEFTLEQLAGDLLPNPTTEQLIATAFHRNTLTNDEGGTDDEEFRVAAVVDRVNTTMQVFMGVTMGCAQCHNHKYDPLTQEEYFNIYAILNNTVDSDKRDMNPTLAEYTGAQLKQKVGLEQHLAELGRTLKAGKDKEQNKKTQEQIQALQKQLATIKPVTTPIMRELPPGQRRKTHILLRGNFLDKGKEVGPGVPAIFPPLPRDKETNRLTLARWLVEPQNPLTARVTVNRFWEQIFGRGLVQTSEDFGIRGKLPTHPELLDWLAVEFRDQRWDMKKMLRLIVTSATYRQSSKVAPGLSQRDPENELYARGPRFRSSAEVIRDQALFASGLLSQKMYGKAARPPRPHFGLSAAFGGSTDWETSPGEDKYRRAVYTEWRRSIPYPSLVSFDAPDRNVCTVKRPRTNTPLQALATLNDPVYVEASQALARRLVKESGPTPKARVTHGFRLCLTRPPRPEEVRRLVDLYQQAKSMYAGNRQAAEQLATQPLGPLPPGMDALDLAAWTVVGNVLLNLDEMVLKR